MDSGTVLDFWFGSVRDPQGRAYNRTGYLSERRKMMQKWADYLDELATGAKVLRLKSTAA